jgi:hypothetical protein
MGDFCLFSLFIILLVLGILTQVLMVTGCCLGIDPILGKQQ